eukprot:893938-Rhodomonas_salina.1
MRRVVPTRCKWQHCQHEWKQTCKNDALARAPGCSKTEVRSKHRQSNRKQVTRRYRRRCRRRMPLLLAPKHVRLTGGGGVYKEEEEEVQEEDQEDQEEEQEEE